VSVLGGTAFGGRGGALRLGHQPGRTYDIVQLESWQRGKARFDRHLGADVVRLKFRTAGEPHPFFAAQGQPTHVALRSGPGRRRVYALVHVDMSAGVAVFRTPYVAKEQD
jgi:hypothetical protein